MKVRLSSEADRTCSRSAIISRGTIRRARTFIQELTDKCASLADMPMGYAVLPRYESRGIRRCVHDNYQLFYRIEGDLILVVRVLHGARDYEALL